MSTLSIRVLIVDDYEPWRRFVISTLQKEPRFLIVGEAADGLTAVQKAQELQPDLILLDIGLPSLNGMDVSRRVRQQSSNLKILFCTENLSPEIAEEALSTGASGYVVKSDAARDLLPAMTAVLQGKRYVSRRFAGHEFAKTPCSFRERGHVVQFYEDDAVLLDGLAALFRSTLRAGGSVVSAMTSPHRKALEEKLIAQGIRANETIRNERLVILDADQALSEFMDADEPSRDRFLGKFGDMIRLAQGGPEAKNRRVLVFGEMVAVLWAQKKYDAAIRLEQLWNELAQTYSFYLCCAYPASALRKRSTGSSYAQICTQHSDVVSAFDTLAAVFDHCQ